MILIIAGAADVAASTLADLWQGARCLRPADLSVPGWRHYVAAEGNTGMVSVGGEPVPDSKITGVLTRITWVSPHELPMIGDVDRTYVATEMSAFLLSWLNALNCPVVNRPTPGCLAGPPWRAAQWVAAAAAAGLRLPATVATAKPSGRSVMLTVVGKRCFGEAAPDLHAAARRLATIACTQLLGVMFDGGGSDAAFLGATAFPPLDDDEIRDALRAMMQTPAAQQIGFPVMRPWRACQAPAISNPATASPIG